MYQSDFVVETTPCVPQLTNPQEGSPSINAFTSKTCSSHSEIHLVPTEWLKGHEECIPRREAEVLTEITSSQGYSWPVIVDRRTGVLLDGHHRHAVAKRLGLARIPAVLVDYLYDNDIRVAPWTPESEHWQEFLANKQLPSTISEGGEDCSCSTAHFPWRYSSREGTKVTEVVETTEAPESLCSDESQGNSFPVSKTVQSVLSQATTSAAADFDEAQDLDGDSIASGLLPSTSGEYQGGNGLVFPEVETIKNQAVTKEAVIAMGLSDKLYPPKSTRHSLPLGLIFSSFVPLSDLMC